MLCRMLSAEKDNTINYGSPSSSGICLVGSFVLTVEGERMMANKNKVNPRRKPATVADVEKAYELGKKETIEFVIAAACLSINDVFSPTQEQMDAFHDKYMSNVYSTTIV